MRTRRISSNVLRLSRGLLCLFIPTLHPIWCQRGAQWGHVELSQQVAFNGGSQAPGGPLFRDWRMSLPSDTPQPPRNSRSKKCLPNELPQTSTAAFGFEVTRYEGRKERRKEEGTGRLKEQVILLQWANGNICHSGFDPIKNRNKSKQDKKTLEASSQTMFQLKALECSDTAVIRSWMRGTL